MYTNVLAKKRLMKVRIEAQHNFCSGFELGWRVNPLPYSRDGSVPENRIAAQQGYIFD
jgi:hypothetical protein